MTDISQALRFIRMVHQMDLENVATVVSLPSSHVAEMESGLKPPSPETLEIFAAFFDCPVSSLFILAEAIEAAQEGRSFNPDRPSKIDDLLEIIPQVFSKIRKEEFE